MNKRLFRNNGMIFINNDDGVDIRYCYFHSNNLSIIKSENMKIEYYKTLSYVY